MFQTALHLAAETGQSTIVDHLLKQGADMSLQDHQGNTAMHLCCIHDNYRSLVPMLERLGQYYQVGEASSILNHDGE